ncbi:MAG TPA: hypothetical protein VN915_04745 [Elusimicrobiota bacterium]|nr:hypothetical protein [Elusimicrobiota bacterium]
MTIKIATAALAALLLSGSVRAEDAKPAPTAKESVMTFFRHLKESLSQSAVQGERKHNRVGSVAAVRGADQSSPLADPNEPVLKGDARSKKDKAQMAEDAEFGKAVDLVISGKTQDGVRALEAFKAQHPKSRDLAKVEQAIDEAKGLIAAKPAEVPAPAAVASTAPAAPAAPAAEAPSVKVDAHPADAPKADAKK